MGTDIREEKIHLHAKEILEMENRSGEIQLTCLEGSLWITQPDDPRDHIVHANESMAVTKKGIILVQALPEAVLRWRPEGR